MPNSVTGRFLTYAILWRIKPIPRCSPLPRVNVPSPGPQELSEAGPAASQRRVDAQQHQVVVEPVGAERRRAAQHLAPGPEPLDRVFRIDVVVPGYAVAVQESVAIGGVRPIVDPALSRKLSDRCNAAWPGLESGFAFRPLWSPIRRDPSMFRTVRRRSANAGFIRGVCYAIASSFARWSCWRASWTCPRRRGCKAQEPSPVVAAPTRAAPVPPPSAPALPAAPAPLPEPEPRRPLVLRP